MKRFQLELRDGVHQLVPLCEFGLEVDQLGVTRSVLHGPALRKTWLKWVVRPLIIAADSPLRFIHSGGSSHLKTQQRSGSVLSSA